MALTWDNRLWCDFCKRLVPRKEIVAKMDDRPICAHCLNKATERMLPNRAVPAGRLMRR